MRSASNLPAARILAANLDWGAGLRPAQVTLLMGLAVAVVPLLVRSWAALRRATSKAA